MNLKGGQKFKIKKTIVTIDGTLYEGELVKYDQKENGHYRVKDSMGKIWYVDPDNLKMEK